MFHEEFRSVISDLPNTQRAPTTACSHFADSALGAPAALSGPPGDSAGDQSRAGQTRQSAALPHAGDVIKPNDQRLGPEQLCLQRPQQPVRVGGPLVGAVEA